MNFKSLHILLPAIFLIGCSNEMKQVPEDRFIGLWELKGRNMFEGIQIRIERENKKLTGKIVRLNDNKLVNMFANTNDIWVASISRSSNFQFKLTERKIGRDLFSLYGLSTSQEFRTEFINDNTIGLAPENTDPQHATILYKRVEH